MCMQDVGLHLHTYTYTHMQTHIQTHTHIRCTLVEESIYIWGTCHIHIHTHTQKYTYTHTRSVYKSGREHQDARYLHPTCCNTLQHAAICEAPATTTIKKWMIQKFLMGQSTIRIIFTHEIQLIWTFRIPHTLILTYSYQIQISCTLISERCTHKCMQR